MAGQVKKISSNVTTIKKNDNDIQINDTEIIDENIQDEEEVTENKKTIKSKTKKSEYKYTEKPDIALHRVVKVLNGTYGRLAYTDPKTNVKLVWEGFGQENYMTVDDLVNMRSHHLKFFQQNWVMFDEEDTDVLFFLGVEKYYQNLYKLEDLNILFTLTPDEIAERVKGMSDGMKRTVANRAYELIQSDEIYDKRIIKVLQEETGFELVE